MVTFHDPRHQTGSLAFFRHPDMDSLFKWALGYASSGGTVIGEVLAAASHIIDGDPESWVDSWERLAQRVEALAAEALAKDQQATARAAYLRAANYWRFSERLITQCDPRLLVIYNRARTCFQTAASLFDPPIEYLEIPFAGGVLPGYFQPAPSIGIHPTLLMFGGTDTIAEELYFWSGPAAAERGYNAAWVDLPGHGGALRLHGLTAQPASEHPVGAILDVLLACPEVHPQRLAVYGVGDGGYHAARAAGHDARITALITNPTITDLHQIEAGAPYAGADTTADPVAEILLARRLWSAGARTVRELLDGARSFTIRDQVEKISCPTLCLLGDADHDDLHDQAHDFYDRLLTSKTLRRFTAADGAATASQVGNLPLQQQIVFDWLDEHWRPQTITAHALRWPSRTPPDLYLG